MSFISRFKRARKDFARGVTTGRTLMLAVCFALLSLVTPSCTQQQTSPISQTNRSSPTTNLTPLAPEILNAPIQTTDGRTIRLADYAGKVVVLDLWATWCPPCREEIPHLVDISREYADRGVEVIGLGIDRNESAQMLTDFGRQLNVNYTLAVAESIVGPAMVRERGGVIPQTYVITRDGRILSRFVGFDPARSAPQLRAAVERAANTQ